MKLSLFNLIVILAFSFRQGTAQTVSDIQKIEKLISAGIRVAYKSSVKVSVYDTLRKKTSSVFSGVVVSADGRVLTAAHASKPNEIYLIQFNDGKSALGKGLGRIAIKEKERNLDLAMIQIQDKGEWPFAEMGSTSTLKLNQPTISISYPGSTVGQLPNIRFGVVSGTDVNSGYFESTCKMEPGDSGGPIYDIEGKLLGIHSWIKISEDDNYEVPINLYRKYWTALSMPVDYKTYPDTTIWQNNKTTAIEIAPIQSLKKMPKRLTGSTVVLNSKIKGVDCTTLGTLIKFTEAGRVLNYIISKSSQTGIGVLLTHKGSEIAVKVLARDKENDLVMLEAPKSLNVKAVKLENKDTVNVTFDKLGKFLFSPFSNDQHYTSVLSSQFTQMPRRFSVGYFGANARFIDQKITITDIAKGSPAANLLKLRDQITGINGKAISRPPEYGSELSKYLVGDSITVEAMRDGKEIQLKIGLTQYNGRNHIADKFMGGRSDVSDGFSKVLFHDGTIPAAKCGGPVFDMEGNFYGINIARYSRTITVIMPATVIIDFIKKNG